MSEDFSKRVLISGSNGMLGKDLCTTLLENNTFEVFGVNRNKDKNLDDKHSIVCDITNFNELKDVLKKVDPKIIIHCAANVNVEECEKNKEKAYKLNSEATKNLAAYKPISTKFVYISTDSVFDGKTGNYSEEDNTNPLNYYAWSKFQGECLALKENNNSMILRTNIYGFHNSGGTSLVEWALKNLKENKVISGFNDVYFNPVYTKQLTRIIIELFKIDFMGIINIGSEKIISKYDFLLILALKFKLDHNCISRSSVDNFKFNAERPKNTSLSVDRLKGLLNTSISLEDGITELFTDINKTNYISSNKSNTFCSLDS